MICPSCGQENLEGSDRCENCLAPFRDLDVPRVDSAEGLARSVMEDNLSKLDHDETINVAPDTPVIEVARLMKDGNSGCALVIDGQKLVGIFTEHDVLLRMTPGGEPAETSGVSSSQWQTPVKDLMSANPETLREEDSVAEALHKMSLGRFRHIPFVKADGTYAVASIRSVIKFIAKEDW
jgi:CBS domain-containing protein